MDKRTFYIDDNQEKNEWTLYSKLVDEENYHEVGCYSSMQDALEGLMIESNGESINYQSEIDTIDKFDKHKEDIYNKYSQLDLDNDMFKIIPDEANDMWDIVFENEDILSVHTKEEAELSKTMCEIVYMKGLIEGILIGTNDSETGISILQKYNGRDSQSYVDAHFYNNDVDTQVYNNNDDFNQMSITDFLEGLE